MRISQRELSGLLSKAQSQLPVNILAKTRSQQRARAAGGDLHYERLRSILGIRKRWMRRASISRGLQNKRISCYRRTAMEVLMHLPAFIRWIQDPPVPPGDMKYALQNFCSAYWNYATKSKALRFFTSKFDSIVNTTGWQWDASEEVQDDSYEFLWWMLDQVRDHSTTDEYQFDALFTPTLQSSWTCESCAVHHQSNPIDQKTGMMLHLNPAEENRLPKNEDQWERPERLNLHNTLPYYIHRFFNQNISLKCSNKVCKTLGIYCQRTRNEKMTSAPEYLIFKCQSFKDDMTKLKTTVDIPQWLDMSDHMAWDVKNYTYKLVSVVLHSGPTTESGHYTGLFTGPRQVQYEINNENVQKKSLKKFKEEMYGTGREYDLPYIVTYVRMAKTH